ncbi:hypothetical protein MA16_Dca018882 [Dendrobium catenatum]|uniref:Reverse transcriptase RNase H-like domain-containing protein n=1 Tax=Dendrobium catenatum TaxID=906689 RepID=A0A2I0VW02_9ASPA|nr:hypothetical protein MA16_Dca018882 [Dendrobium catenatum]
METLDALKIHYLDKPEINLRTDCQAIIAFYNKSTEHKPSRVRWLSFTDYINGLGITVRFEHIEGKNNILADNLSRLTFVFMCRKYTERHISTINFRKDSHRGNSKSKGTGEKPHQPYTRSNQKASIQQTGASQDDHTQIYKNFAMDYKQKQPVVEPTPEELRAYFNDNQEKQHQYKEQQQPTILQKNDVHRKILQRALQYPLDMSQLDQLRGAARRAETEQTYTALKEIRILLRKQNRILYKTGSKR